MRLNFTNVHQFSSKMVSFQKRSAPQFHKCSPIFTNFRRKWAVFKKGVRFNLTNFHEFSSKIACFQIRSEPQFHRFSPIVVETCQFSKKECASISRIFMRGDTAMRNPPVVVSRGGEGEGLPLPGRSLLENGRAVGGFAPGRAAHP